MTLKEFVTMSSFVLRYVIPLCWGFSKRVMLVSEEVSSNNRLWQVTHVAQSHARTGAFAPRLEQIITSVTARGRDILDKTAQRVSLNDSHEVKLKSGWVCRSGLFNNSFPVFFFLFLTAEFLTWLKISLKPSPNTVHYILTHFKGFWNIINNISFLRDAIMRYVLTCKCFYLKAK